ncbi:hypothetical protein barba108A_phanotate142 [Rheinheimera phage vB_RspM_barba_10-8A]|uniref:Uncharacterized protein n=31 Tax=Barbavirus barba18A TaxID=2734090 RepID=A0A7G9VS73_9CAUD|nr:hypothetical protein barba13A_phanotate160 [Rheinheimera phage vB_RspM_barba_1-3A]QNO01653.1 hypothetical protein barba108A_phanotate142 [Rheinheimera phage vB_RspM_barba_10-8A]QNO01780.1 hypothetical protein barba108B_phanotate109 [Rheinheimera phage vB_RspM_barba_10-8B]QNO01974.1 hypothetical protein barba108D_phanotate143 [Rheinheimera phage vB_RspM_barba_10-8D]QNO03136.1 hypothetical protein barba109G_phanotate160 [Rheinheimera phage vB_RspM_barba_10-9G]QNO03159.1 hypothetical protein b
MPIFSQKNSEICTEYVNQKFTNRNNSLTFC